ncbi:hypothetical protein PSTG_00537 [Puccinia striiformis f. sp. tritici PST-78]|uniref:Uncharacterized protein n=1 Tax=Puccinia striiformis f. sp. tritici PST-78 TaxID=1165861 RepID=A0A0L0W556_9BASI|nr:hypothetical protein PSTG_00537 [Puccinia striiformis f. sp. tritici PST-78]
MTRTPQSRKKRNHRKLPSPSILSPKHSTPPLDDQPIDDQANLTQTDYPSTSQLSTSIIRELTDQEELLRAQRTAENALTLERFRCGGKFNRPMSDSSCSNLLRHQAACLVKQNNQKTSRKLASVGVPQLCAIWCAEAARPFQALEHLQRSGCLLRWLKQAVTWMTSIFANLGYSYGFLRVQPAPISKKPLEIAFGCPLGQEMHLEGIKQFCSFLTPACYIPPV